MLSLINYKIIELMSIGRKMQTQKLEERHNSPMPICNRHEHWRIIKSKQCEQATKKGLCFQLHR